MCGNEQFLQRLWTDDSIDMSEDDLLFAIRLNGFKLLGRNSKRLFLEKIA